MWVAPPSKRVMGTKAAAALTVDPGSCTVCLARSLTPRINLLPPDRTADRLLSSLSSSVRSFLDRRFTHSRRNTLGQWLLGLPARRRSFASRARGLLFARSGGLRHEGFGGKQQASERGPECMRRGTYADSFGPRPCPALHTHRLGRAQLLRKEADTQLFHQPSELLHTVIPPAPLRSATKRQ